MSCPTGEPRYRDQVAAQSALTVQRRRDPGRHVRECGSCGGWHVNRTPRD
ncbi:hypothetical protein [Streptomyces canus]